MENDTKRDLSVCASSSQESSSMSSSETAVTSLLLRHVGTSRPPLSKTGSALCAGVALLVLLSWIRRRRKRSCPHQLTSPTCSSLLHQAQIQRKNSFLKRAGNDYGYVSSSGGHIDTWRQLEYPHLISPINYAGNGDRGSTLHSDTSADISSREDSDQTEPEVYLDYAGSALPSASQLSSIMNDYQAYGVLANPHSTGPAASRTMVRIERVKKMVMDHFNAHPGRSYGIGKDNGSNGHQSRERLEDGDGTDDHHPGYDFIFTSGATESLRIVAETFPWTSAAETLEELPSAELQRCRCACHDSGSKANSDEGVRRRRRNRSVLLYTHNAHTSVVGMRGSAVEKGAAFQCVPLDKIGEACVEDFATWGDHNGSSVMLHEDDDLSCTCCQLSSCEVNQNGDPNHLLVLPAECNFGGDCPKDITKIIKKARASQKSQWYVMLDLAKAASTGPVDLRKLDPDFACLSFYKMFGEPTGLGVLFVKRSSMHVLEDRATSQPKESGVPISRNRSRYFGGGSVDAVLSGRDFVHPRSEPSSLSSFVHGTVHFRGIASLSHGFNELKRVGGMEKISLHSRCLAREFVRRIRLLKHGNGRPVCVIYGAWSDYDEINSDAASLQIPGPTIAFNVLRCDGSIVGYNEVSNLAGLNRPPIQFRTGCFCNSGACQMALGLSDEEIQDNYYVAGHVCGDKKDIINGGPTGAVRASFGKDSIWEDLDAVVAFLGAKFACDESDPTGDSHTIQTHDNVPMEYTVAEIFVFPVKSCAAMKVERWPLDSRGGRFRYDREFALVDSTGNAMRLHSFPQMCMILPSIDLERRILKLRAPGCDDLEISLDDNESRSSVETGSGEGRRHIRVCGSKACAKVWGGTVASDWFSSFLGVQCWLVRHNGTNSPKHHGRELEEASSTSSSASAPPIGQQRTKAFANDAAILLVSQDSINILNKVLSSQGSKHVTSRHFRPNLVVKRENYQYGDVRDNPEDSWSRIKVEGTAVEFKSEGHCARCQMVDVDPTSGMKGKTLRALAEYRRRGGQIVFGVFLSVSERGKDGDIEKDGDLGSCHGISLLKEYEMIAVGDRLACM
mmetsp:Transcript_11847/g.25654  ORF Transcript_11847/g.25654 Transcript_11847/m.25654 type:complete len:1072 (-) Transcript_11847:84-3299(-)